jgi:hypothetical protein
VHDWGVAAPGVAMRLNVNGGGGGGGVQPGESSGLICRWSAAGLTGGGVVLDGAAAAAGDRRALIMSGSDGMRAGCV